MQTPDAEAVRGNKKDSLPVKTHGYEQHAIGTDCTEDRVKMRSNEPECILEMGQLWTPSRSGLQRVCPGILLSPTAMGRAQIMPKKMDLPWS